MKKIGYIGLGKLGLPCAEVIIDKGHHVTGYDTTEVISSKVLIVQSIKECVQDKDVVFVAVPTPHDKDYDGCMPVTNLQPKDFSYDIVKTKRVA